MAALGAWLDYAGVATFAASSAIVSRRERLDLTATVLIACIAAIGGGTLRDLLIPRPVFWIVDPSYVVACLVAAVLVWFVETGRRIERLVALLEAIGIGCFAVVGTAKARDAGIGQLAAVALGTVTATFGGIVGDALVGRGTVLARKEIYMTAAIAAALSYDLLLLVGAPKTIAAGLGALTGVGVRLSALRFGWSMPAPRGKR